MAKRSKAYRKAQQVKAQLAHQELLGILKLNNIKGKTTHEVDAIIVNLEPVLAKAGIQIISESGVVPVPRGFAHQKGVLTFASAQMAGWNATLHVKSPGNCSICVEAAQHQGENLGFWVRG